MKNEANIRIRVGEKVIAFTRDNAILCDQKDGWDVDFDDLRDEWLFQLESEWLFQLEREKDFLFYLRIDDSAKRTKVLYFQALRREDGEFQTYCLEPIVVQLTSKDFHEVTILNGSGLFRNIDCDDD